MNKSRLNYKDYFWQSPFAFFIILTNVFFFGFIHFTYQGYYLLESLVLNPQNLERGIYTTLLTSGFIHVNFVHLFLNMLGVFVFGRIVEEHLGAAKTFFIYFGALIISMFLTVTIHNLLGDNRSIVGASGAVMGLVAAAMLLDPFFVSYEMIIPLPVMMKGWLFLYGDLQGLLNGQRDGISHLAHLLGFLSIGILVYFLSRKDKKLMREGLIINIISFIVFVLAWKFLVGLKAAGSL